MVTSEEARMFAEFCSKLSSQQRHDLLIAVQAIGVFTEKEVPKHEAG